MKLDDFLQKARDKLRPSRKTIVLVSVNAVLLLFSLVLFVTFFTLRARSTSQRAAALWANGNGESYAQVSVFFDASNGLDETQAYDVSDKIAKLLRENSIEPANSEAKPFNHAYSGTVMLNVSSDLNSSEAVATGVGGDFFFFHGFELIHGSLLSEDDLQTDVVVIDDVLAWRLYGASNVTGFEITVAGKPCRVGGVVKRGDAWPDSLTYGEQSRIFLPYQTLKQISPAVSISCFEAVLPNPVSGFGRKIVEDAVSMDERYREIVENSERNSVPSLIRSLTRAGKNAMQTKSIAYPYWENAARYASNVFALMLTAAFVLPVATIVCLIILFVRVWRAKGAVWRAVTGQYRKKQLDKWNKREKKDETVEKDEVSV